MLYVVPVTLLTAMCTGMCKYLDLLSHVLFFDIVLLNSNNIGLHGGENDKMIICMYVRMCVLEDVTFILNSYSCVQLRQIFTNE